MKTRVVNPPTRFTHKQMLAAVTPVPRMACEIHRELEGRQSKNESFRKRRRYVGQALGDLARDGQIALGLAEGRRFFWRPLEEEER